MRAHALLLALVAAAGLCASGCSKTVCVEACEKQKSCASALDCTKVPGAEKAGCEYAKRTFGSEDCEGKKTCGDAEKTAAKEIVNCTLDNYCGCKSTIPDGGRPDIFCNRPATISSCFAPGDKLNTYSKDKYWCTGCGDCEGNTPAPACSLMNSDCRYFATSCIPKTYAMCDETVKSDQLWFLCGYCFFREAGGAAPQDCDKLKGSEAGVGPKDLPRKQ